MNRQDARTPGRADRLLVAFRSSWRPGVLAIRLSGAASRMIVVRRRCTTTTRTTTRTTAFWLGVLVLILAGCPSSENCPAGWKEVFDRAELDRPILALWGAGDDVYAVGGGVRDSSLQALV